MSELLTPDQQARALAVLRDLVNALDTLANQQDTLHAREAAAEFLASCQPFEPEQRR